ncbi:hypothetical protein SNEBB_011403 [Seison nebaliae]|nr:hypothetical protein SNEBB_011403 [Seison nebaliae]
MVARRIAEVFSIVILWHEINVYIHRTFQPPSNSILQLSTSSPSNYKIRLHRLFHEWIQYRTKVKKKYPTSYVNEELIDENDKQEFNQSDYSEYLLNDLEKFSSFYEKWRLFEQYRPPTESQSDDAPLNFIMPPVSQQGRTTPKGSLSHGRSNIHIGGSYQRGNNKRLNCINNCIYAAASDTIQTRDGRCQPDDKHNISTVEEFMEYCLTTNYDRKIRPFFRQKIPVNVSMTMHIMSISSINEVNMDFTLDLYFRQIWRDPRLAFNHENKFKNEMNVTLHYEQINNVWIPDTFFRNSKEGRQHDVTVPNRLVRVYSNGTILFSQRITLKLECPMKLQKFPLDNQTCGINIGSYAYTMKDLQFRWKYGRPISHNSLKMPDFKLENISYYQCDQKTSTGAFTCIKAEFLMQRLFGFYLIQVFLPSILIVCLSFVSFWIDHRAVPARISLGLLTVLTVTTQSSGIRTQLPRVSYVKAIDVWMSTCLVFVFAALLEYAFVNVMARKQVETARKARKKLQKRRRKNRVGKHSTIVDGNSNDENVPVLMNCTATMDNEDMLFKKSSADGISHHHPLYGFEENGQKLYDSFGKSKSACEEIKNELFLIRKPNDGLEGTFANPIISSTTGSSNSNNMITNDMNVHLKRNEKDLENGNFTPDRQKPNSKTSSLSRCREMKKNERLLNSLLSPLLQQQQQDQANQQDQQSSNENKNNENNEKSQCGKCNNLNLENRHSSLCSLTEFNNNENNIQPKQQQQQQCNHQIKCSNIDHIHQKLFKCNYGQQQQQQQQHLPRYHHHHHHSQPRYNDNSSQMMYGSRQRSQPHRRTGYRHHHCALCEQTHCCHCDGNHMVSCTHPKPETQCYCNHGDVSYNYPNQQYAHNQLLHLHQHYNNKRQRQRDRQMSINESRRSISSTESTSFEMDDNAFPVDECTHLMYNNNNNNSGNENKQKNYQHPNSSWKNHKNGKFSQKLLGNITRHRNIMNGNNRNCRTNSKGMIPMTDLNQSNKINKLKDQNIDVLRKNNTMHSVPNIEENEQKTDDNDLRMRALSLTNDAQPEGNLLNSLRQQICLNMLNNQLKSNTNSNTKNIPSNQLSTSLSTQQLAQTLVNMAAGTGQNNDMFNSSLLINDASKRTNENEMVKRAQDSAEMIDFLSRFIFPFAFVLFNIIYWMIYLNMEVKTD